MPELVNQVDINGDTPLIIAIEHGNAAAANILIASANPDVSNHFGFQALLYAAYFGEEALCVKLAPITTTQKTEQMTAQHMAQVRGHYSIAVTLTNLLTVAGPMV